MLKSVNFKSLTRKLSYSSFFSVLFPDSKNVFFGKIHWAPSDVPEVKRSFSRSKKIYQRQWSHFHSTAVQWSQKLCSSCKRTASLKNAVSCPTRKVSIKGLLNLEWIYEFIVSTKMQTKTFKDFYTSRAEILQSFGWLFGRNVDLICSFWI